MSILSDLVVLDLTESLCGAYASLQLANYGAEVLRLGTGISVLDRADLCASGIPGPEAQTLHDLLPRAHVFLADRTTLPQDCTPELLREHFPQLVIATIREDPKVGGPLSEAASGLMDMTGFSSGTPTLSGGRAAECFAGVSLAFAILAAVHQAEEQALGTHIDYSLYDAYYALLESPILFRELQNICPSRCGNADSATLVPYDVYRCKDGYFSAGLASDAGWDRFCTVLGMPELIDDPRFDTNEKRCQRYGELTALISPYFMSHTKEELQAGFTEKNIPNAPVLSAREAMRHPQLLARAMVRENASGIPVPGTPMKMSATKAVFDP